MHLALGCVSSLLIWVVRIIHRRTQRKRGAVLPGYRLPIEAVAVVIVVVTAPRRIPQRSERTRIGTLPTLRTRVP
jgi:hypothetical protein